ncbi:MAG: diguanylate cyclase [Moraxellaceae bacterium]|nr:diguanylate cyclase [Moraxellaceae bacterium]
MLRDEAGAERPLHSEDIQRLLDSPRDSLGFREPFESLFQQDQQSHREYQSRAGLVLGILIFSLFGIMDWLLMREVIFTVWALRFGAVALMLGYLFLSSRLRRGQLGQSQYVCTILIALAIIGVVAIAPASGRYVYLMALVLLLLFSFILLRTPFNYCLRSTALIVMLHNAVLLTVADVPALEWLSHNIFLLSAAGIALAANYLLERNERRAFLQTLLVRQQKAELEDANARLQRLAIEDPLTGLANRRLFESQLDEEWRRCLRQELPLAVMMIDVDSFKLYNDTYGHQAGDECLARIAEELRCYARRPGDCVARYGGEEFVIVWPGASAEEAGLEMQKLNEQIRRLRIRHHVSPVTDVVTLSIGVAACIPTANDSPFRLVREADMALYHAKKQGRDRCVLASPAASQGRADVVILNIPRP